MYVRQYMYERGKWTRAAFHGRVLSQDLDLSGKSFGELGTSRSGAFLLNWLFVKGIHSEREREREKFHVVIIGRTNSKGFSSVIHLIFSSVLKNFYRFFNACGVKRNIIGDYSKLWSWVIEAN